MWVQVYKRVLDKPITDVRSASVCMRENPFYVDTVKRLAGPSVVDLSN